MHPSRIAVAVAIAWLASGCGPAASLHPLYTDDVLVLVPGLAGKWRAPDAEEALSFEEKEGKWYESVFTEPERSSRMTIHAVRLGEYTFLDLVLADDCGSVPVISPHLFCRIAVSGDSLQLAYLDEEWLRTMVREGDVHIAHEDLDGQIVLTAKTRDLQRFVLQYAADALAFPDSQTLYRQE